MDGVKRINILLVVGLIGICFPSLTWSQLICQRCYGKGFCNNASHPDYAANIRNATCNVDVNFTSDDPILNHIQKTINDMNPPNLGSNDADTLNTIQGHCLTATVHEPHDSHTLRTCVTRSVPAGNTVPLCELLKTIIAPLNWYGGNFTCRACNENHFCNNHTLGYGDGLAESTTPQPTTVSPPTTPSAATFIEAFAGLLIFTLSLYKLI